MLKFSVDDLVFVSHKNRPNWPGKVLEVPKDEQNKKYKIHLFGANQEILSLEKNLSNFTENYSEFGKPTSNKERNSGLWDALFDPGLLGLQKPQNLTLVLQESFDASTKDAPLDDDAD